MKTAVNQHLTSDEESLRTWTGELVDEENESSERATFRLTDRRLICVTTGGQFKDIGYSHISSIEADEEIDRDYEGKSWKWVIGGGVLLLLTGISIGGSDIGTMLLSFVLGAILVWYGWNVRSEDRWNSFTVIKTKVYTLKVITGDELTTRMVFKTTEDVAGNISHAVRQLG
jgi:hypothetical protein